MAPFRCRSCQTAISARDELAGKVVACPKCKTKVRVPAIAAPAAPVAAAPPKPKAPPATRKPPPPDEEFDDVEVDVPKPRRKRAIASTGLLLVLLGVLGWVVWTRFGPDPERDPFSRWYVPPEGARGADIVPAPPLEPIPEVPDKAPVRVARKIEPQAAKEPAKEISTAAVLDLTGQPVGVLFETKILSRERLKWVERSRLKDLVDEKELQKCFSPQGGDSRMDVGRMLKADVLVFLREVAADPPANPPDDKAKKNLELIVCETRQGLRLAVSTFPADGDAAEVVEELDARVGEALGKLARPIVDVCAVPPFLSEDLDFKFDHLKAAFARSLEQHLLTRPGVVVIDLAEAQAIARESVEVTGTGLERRLPLSYLGSYRNKGTGDDRRLTVTLRLKRGETVVGTKTLADVDPKDAPRLVREACDALGANALAKADAKGEAIADPEIETQELLARARSFGRLANWREAIDLSEAGLLLDPQNGPLQLYATDYYGNLARILFSRRSGVPSPPPGLALEAMSMVARGIDLQEGYLRPREKLPVPVVPKLGSKIPPPHESNSLSGCVREVHALKSDKDAQVKAVRDEVIAHYRASMLRLCRWRAQAGYGDEHRYLVNACHDLPDDKVAALKMRMIIDLKDLPNAEARTRKLLGGDSDVLHSARIWGFALQLAERPDPPLRDAGRSILRDLELAKTNGPTKRADLYGGVAKVDAVRNEPVELKVDGAGKPIKWLRSCLPVGDATDLVAANNAIYLMKEKGSLRLLWDAREQNAHVSGWCYDGKYVWAPITRLRKPPLLLVIDPASASVRDVSSSAGLPFVDQKDLPHQHIQQTLHATPLAPGKACLVGSFGRSWVAAAEFDGRAATVKMLHEAPIIVDRNTPAPEKMTDVAFEPLRVFTLRGPDGEQRLLIVRGGQNGYLETTPLLVNPQTGAASVLNERCSNIQSGAEHDGAVYFVGIENIDPKNRTLFRISFPGTRTALGSGLKDASVHFANAKMYALTQHEWFVDEIPPKQMRPLGTFTLEDHANCLVFRSAHYGLLVRSAKGETFRPVFE